MNLLAWLEGNLLGICLGVLFAPLITGGIGVLTSWVVKVSAPTPAAPVKPAPAPTIAPPAA